MLKLFTFAVVALLAAPAARVAAGRLWWLLTTLLLALFLSFMLEPVLDRLARRGVRRGLAAGVVMLLSLVLLTLFGVLVGAVVVDQSRTLVGSLPGHIEYLQSTLDGRGVEISVSGYVEQFSDHAASQMVSLGGAALLVLGQSAMVLFFGFYLAVDGPRVRRSVCSVLPPRRQRLLLQVWELAIEKTGEFILSRLFLAVISALVHVVAFSIIGLPAPLVLGLFVGLISQVIPSLGTYLAAAAPLLVSFAESLGMFAVVLVIIVSYQQVENYLVVPRVQRHIMNVHPALGLGAVIMGVSLLGVPGALLALPLTAMVQAFVSSYIHRYELVDAVSLTSPDPRDAQ